MQLLRAGTLPSDSFRSYLAESTRPLASAALIAPLLLIYELGVAVLGPHALRNGADVWLRYSLEWFGFGQYFLLPLLTCGILLGWHHMRQDTWSLNGSILPLMFIESVLLALLLFWIAHVQRAIIPGSVAIGCAVSASGAGTLGRLIGYCGAGIYEELLFRLMMLPAAAWCLARTGLTPRASWAWAIVSTSLFFSAAHYQLVSAAGYDFDWYSFLFRLTAGMFFAVLFVFRGFGIAAAAHALYDIFVEIL